MAIFKASTVPSKPFMGGSPTNVIKTVASKNANVSATPTIKTIATSPIKPIVLKNVTPPALPIKPKNITTKPKVLNQPLPVSNSPVVKGVAASASQPATSPVLAKLASSMGQPAPLTNAGSLHSSGPSVTQADKPNMPATDKKPFWKKYLPYLIGGGVLLIGGAIYFFRKKVGK